MKRGKEQLIFNDVRGVFVVCDFHGDCKSLVSSELIRESDSTFDAVQCVVDGLVTVKNVSPDGVPCVMNEWDCNCFVNEKVALCWYVLRCPVFGVQSVGEEKQCSLDADFGFYVNDLCPCVDETDVVSRVDDVGVV